MDPCTKGANGSLPVAMVTGNGDSVGIFAKLVAVNGSVGAHQPAPPPFRQRVIASQGRRDACRADGASPSDEAAGDSVDAEEADDEAEPETETDEQPAFALAHDLAASTEDWGGRVRVLAAGSQLRELHTLLRDRDTSRSDFVFYADRLIRLVVEEALNCLPYEPLRVTTPGGQPYEGLRGTRGSCGVSVMRSGEAMEKGLRDCCRAIRIGKILIQREDDCSEEEPEPIYVKLPPGVQQRRVLLMQPVLGDGRVAAKALQLLTQDYRVPQSGIFLLNIFSTRAGLDRVLATYPKVSVLTSEVHDLVPYHFCARYFGTD